MENDSTNDRRSVDPRDQPSLLGRKRATPSSPSSKDNEEDTDMDWMLIPPPSADTLSLNDHSHNGKDDDDDNDCEKVEDEDNAIAGFYWQSSIQTETGGNWGQAVQAAASFNQQMLWERRLRGPFYKDIHTNSVQVVDSFFVNNLETPSPSYLKEQRRALKKFIKERVGPEWFSLTDKNVFTSKKRVIGYPLSSQIENKKYYVDLTNLRSIPSAHLLEVDPSKPEDPLPFACPSSSSGSFFSRPSQQQSTPQPVPAMTMTSISQPPMTTNASASPLSSPLPSIRPSLLISSPGTKPVSLMHPMAINRLPLKLTSPSTIPRK